MLKGTSVFELMYLSVCVFKSVCVCACERMNVFVRVSAHTSECVWKRKVKSVFS